MLNFDEQYQSMTDEELLNVARDSQDLTPEARNSLNGELSRRRMTSGQITKYEHVQRNEPATRSSAPKLRIHSGQLSEEFARPLRTGSTFAMRQANGLAARLVSIFCT
jgi:hypothetical protein